MKKSALFLGLLAVASLCLTACGNSKDYTMSFEEAVDAAKVIKKVKKDSRVFVPKTKA